MEQLQGLRASHQDAGFNSDPTKSARAKMIELLRESGDLIEAKPITHAVKCAERSGAPLEILTTQQWFVDILNQKEALLARSRACNWHPTWMAKRMEQWIEGLSMDWCISRQRYYGVPFPVWYVQSSVIGDRSSESGAEAEIIVAEPDELPINPLTQAPKGYKLEKIEDGLLHTTQESSGRTVILKPESDVFDTWFTSSISPQLSSGGIGEWSVDESSDRHARLYPADLRPQAHEIIRTWAFYTLVKSHYHGNCEPWKNLMISGWCLAEDKQKMSKSKGNVVTPIALIEEHGADVVRYWASTSKLGQDTAFSKDLLKIGKKLVTKLWNATKFAAIHLEKLPEGFANQGKTAQQMVAEGDISATLDKWILTRLHHTIAEAGEAFTAYEYAAALRKMEDFFWNDFCDNYLELVKKRAYGEQENLSHRERACPGPVPGRGGETLAPDQSRPPSPTLPLEGGGSEPASSSKNPHPKDANALSTSPSGRGIDSAQASAVYTIYYCLDGILRLFAPILPHITEELWSHLFEENYAATGSIHARGNWLQPADYPVNETAEAQGIAVVALLEEVRKAKSEAGVSIKRPFAECVITQPLDGSAEADFKAAGNILQLRVETATTGKEGEQLISHTLAPESDAAYSQFG
jgi:valyl-tRNA synthetase